MTPPPIVDVAPLYGSPGGTVLADLLLWSLFGRLWATEDDHR